MKIVSLSENRNIEKRIAITPDTAKKFKSLGFEIILSEKYGEHLGFTDADYKDLGVNFSSNEKDILEKADIMVQVSLPSEEIFLI